MTFTQVICATIALCAIIAATVLLAWHGTLNGQAVIGLFSGLSFAGIIGGTTHAATKAGARAARRGGERD